MLINQILIEPDSVGLDGHDTHLRFSPLYSFSRNLVNWSWPIGSISSSRRSNPHRFTLRSGTSLLLCVNRFVWLDVYWLIIFGIFLLLFVASNEKYARIRLESAYLVFSRSHNSVLSVCHGLGSSGEVKK